MRYIVIYLDCIIHLEERATVSMLNTTIIRPKVLHRKHSKKALSKLASERDAWLAQMSAYYSSFETLVSDLRADLNTPDLPVFIPSYMADEELLDLVISTIGKEVAAKAEEVASKAPESDVERIEAIISYLEQTGSLKKFGKRPYAVQVIMAQNRAGREMPMVTTFYPGELPRNEGDNAHYNSEGYVLLGKKTASAVEEFDKGQQKDSFTRR